MMFYFQGRCLAYWVCRFFGKAEFIGTENVPETGPAMLCGNHLSHIDPPALGAGVKRHVHFMAKIELFHYPIVGFFMSRIGAIPVKRGTADRKALKDAMDYLKSGELVGMFPEGTRSLDGNIAKAEAGVGLIILRTKAPVIPVALINTQKLFPPHSIFLRFAKIKIVYGKPVILDDLYDQSGRDAINEVGIRIMAAIQQLKDENAINN